MTRNNSGSPSTSVDEGPTPSQFGRETVESIVVAVILAFLFRSFVAEAFIIPTGSMAPTLQGRHTDVACDGCGFRYRCGASRSDPSEVACPNCGLQKEPAGGRFSNERPFSGDRILVSKFAYDLKRPQRWDVIVFKFPGNAKQNYIKRLVGLPNELLKIWHGNAYATPMLFSIPADSRAALEEGQIDEVLRAGFEDVDESLSAAATVEPVPVTELEPYELRPATRSAWMRLIRDGDREFWVAEHEDRLHIFRAEFEILRKPPSKLLAMLQCVHDTKYVNKQLDEAGWPHRWSGDGWKSEIGKGRRFSREQPTAAGEVAWLNYRHRFPSSAQWGVISQGGQARVQTDSPGELITDHYAYNYAETRSNHGNHWVGDLAVEASVRTSSNEGAVWLQLVRAGRHHRCRFDLATGEARLDIDGADAGFGADGRESQPTAQSSMRGAGNYELRMTNVDDEMRVWVNNRLLEFNQTTSYQPPQNDVPQWSPDDPGDTEPVGIGAEQASLVVSRLRVLRDIYYVAVDAKRAQHGFENDYHGRELHFDTPLEWTREIPVFNNRRNVSYVLGGEQYFPMGDNSPYSEDARRWSARGFRHLPSHYVTEDLLIGKALLIYWPHMWRPFLPNYGRMGLIR
ncbi:MAG: hypothetical protein KDB14_30720 [Planctomycetales bacterium]|nr:hypothetical protein [Planctomycetales bacterium]